MGDKTAGELAAELSLLLHQKLGLKGGGLEAKIARAGRRLPSRIRRRATEIAEAEKLAANPRLARQIDPATLARAAADVRRHLTGIDPGERRRGMVLSMLGSIALALIATFGVTVGVLVWRGYL